MAYEKTALVCGAGGFIGNHSCRLKREGFWVRGVDLKYPALQRDRGRRFRRRRPARSRTSCARRSIGASTRSTSSPPTWAAPATSSPARTTPTSCTTRRRSISTCWTRAQQAQQPRHLLFLLGLHVSGVQPGGSGQSELRRGHRLPGRPRQRVWLGEAVLASGSTSPTPATMACEVRVARYHNIFGPEGTWNGGKEKAPAAICRKVARGDGRRRDRDLGRRPADPLVPLHRRMPGGHAAPDAVRLDGPGQHRLGGDGHDQPARRRWSRDIAGKTIDKQPHSRARLGVRGRNSDNRLIEEKLGWKPSTRLAEGLRTTSAGSSSSSTATSARPPDLWRSDAMNSMHRRTPGRPRSIPGLAAPGWINLLGVRVGARPAWRSRPDRRGNRDRPSWLCLRDRRPWRHRVPKGRGLRSIHNRAYLVTPDGMPLVWSLKLGGHTLADRVYGPDLMLAVFDAARQRRRRHFLYGSTPDTLAKLEAEPQGTISRRRDRRQLLAALPPARASRGGGDRPPHQRERRRSRLGGPLTPRQERWMAAMRPRLNAPVLIGVGAAFDFHAGLKRQAPRAIQRSGLEWIFRLATEPARLWRRYATIVPAFLVLAGAQALGRRIPIDEPPPGPGTAEPRSRGERQRGRASARRCSTIGVGPHSELRAGRAAPARSATSRQMPTISPRTG